MRRQRIALICGAILLLLTAGCGEKQPEEAAAPLVRQIPIQETSGSIGDLMIVANPASVEVLVNKRYALPESYEPSDLVFPDVPFTFEERIDKRKMRSEAAHAGTPEAEWLAARAYEYGFIIRYPKDKEEITGFKYEPWHIRYVGEEMAGEIEELSTTLDEYYGSVPVSGNRS